jgi:hypothetical protein
LELEARHAGHPDVEEEAGGRVRRPAGQVGLRGFEQLELVAGRAQQAAESLAYGAVVVDDDDPGRRAMGRFWRVLS